MTRTHLGSRTRAGLAAALALLSLAGCSGAPGPDPDVTRASGLPQKIFVLYLEDASGSNDPGLAERLTELLVAQIRLVCLSTLGPREVEAIYREMGSAMPARFDLPAMRRFAEITGSEAVVMGKITEYRSGASWGEDRLALAVRLVDAQSGKVIRGTSFVSDASDLDATVRGMDQLLLRGVERVTESLARAR